MISILQKKFSSRPDRLKCLQNMHRPLNRMIWGFFYGHIIHLNPIRMTKSVNKSVNSHKYDRSSILLDMY
jgi:hypothetical protein